MTTAIERERLAVIEDLASEDEEIRRLAVERLLTLPASEAIPRLVESLGDTSWRVRKAGVERLVASSESDAVVSALIGALADGENPGRRNSAVEALVACGPRVIPSLLEALGSDDVDVRKLIVDALGGIGDAAAQGPLIGTLRDADPNVRAAACDALGILGGDEVSRALRGVAVDGHEDRLVRFSALWSLVRLECEVDVDELRPLLDDPVLRPPAFALLGYCDVEQGAEACLLKGLAAGARSSREAAMEGLIRQYARRDGRQADLLADAIREVVRGTDGLLDSAVERLREADLTVRLMLVQFLGLVGTEECVVPILESGRDEAIAEVAHTTLEALDVTAAALERHWSILDASLRESACARLARIPGTAGTRRLCEALDDPDSRIRAAAAGALGARGVGDALPDLVRRIEVAAVDEEPESEEELEAMLAALVQLLERGDDALTGQAGELLAARLESPTAAVRGAAAYVLARVARAEDVDRIIGLLRDPSAQVRRLAVEGLARFDAGATAETLRLALADESPTVRMTAAGVLGASMRGGALRDLQRLLDDEDVRVRAAAIQAIGACCSSADMPVRREGIGLLASTLSEEGCDGMVAIAAIDALDQLGGDDAAGNTAVALTSAEPEVVQAAVACIGRHGTRETLAELIPLVQHPSWAVRGEAIQVLAARRVANALPAILRRSEIEQDSFVREAIVDALRRLEG